ncbi:hypothetical protein [Nocardioides humi]|uniref:Antirestriction protein (ArdA) n=1 Tax=Nocardioides humi TaxID=449461 RepID=A0ABN2A1M3_9ACTN|nr:hypothetical protein [Nocardioides humi]
MNHEQNQPGGVSQRRYEPRHRAEQRLAANATDLHTEPDSDQYVRHVIEHAPSPAAGALVAQLYERHGTAFAIYLALGGVDNYIRDNGEGPRTTDIAGLERDFTEAYYDFFPDKDALVEDTIASFDWGAEASWLLRGHLELQQFLVFDRDAIYGFASDHYEVIRTDQGLYVYMR